MIKREIKIIDPYYMESMFDGNKNGVFMVKLDTLPSHIKNDIIEFIEENNIKNIPEDGFYRIETLLRYYLEWNGIVGWTEDIMSIIKHADICKVLMIKEEVE